MNSKMIITLGLGALAMEEIIHGEVDHQIEILKILLEKQRKNLENIKLANLGIFLFL